MLQKLYFVEDIMERYKVKDPKTARKYMREMGAQPGKPFFVTEAMITVYERMKTTPQEPVKKGKSPKIRRAPRTDELKLIEYI